MTPTECIDFVDGLDPEDLARTEHALNPAVTDGEPGWLVDGFKRGFYRITTTQLGGWPLYRYVWHVTDQNALYINASLFVGQPGQNDSWLWMIGAEMIARAMKCAGGIIFDSQRKGHLIQAQRAGFKVAGVRMIKTFDNAPA